MPRKTATKTGISAGLERGANDGNGSANHDQEQQLSMEEIAARAYEIYEREGRADGRDMEHWLRAESELRSERSNGRENSRENGRAATENAPRSARLRQEGQGAGAQGHASHGMSGAMNS